MLYGAVLWWGVCSSPLGQRITLTLDDLTGNGFSARDIRVQVLGGGDRGASVAIDVGSLNLGAHVWRQVKLNCVALKMGAEVSCDEGVLSLGEKIPVKFKYQREARALEVVLLPSAQERYRISVSPSSVVKAGNDVRVLMTRRDRAGEVIEGGRTQPVVELWTFARDPRAADPNWKLVATRPAE